MKTITVTTQKELDALPDVFNEYTTIKIHAASKIIVKKARGNSSVEAWENSSVEAWENSSVVARGNSSVAARGNSSVEALENSSVVAWGNSSVAAWGNSSVEALGNSSVVARDNSSVEALGNSSVVAWENSSVEARENSSVVAWGNSSVVARENSSVEARGNTVVRLFNQIKRLVLNKFSVAISIGFAAKVDFKADTAQLIEQPVATYDKEEFLDIYSKNVQPDGSILLYKSTRDDDTDFYTGKIKYEGVVHPNKWNPDPNLQCGDGLHLSPTPVLALSYHNGKIKKCLVKPKDFVVYPHDISKVRCREVEVIPEQENK